MCRILHEAWAKLIKFSSADWRSGTRPRLLSLKQFVRLTSVSLVEPSSRRSLAQKFYKFSPSYRHKSINNIMSEEKKYPESCVGLIIYNDNGEILLIQCPKWGDYWHIPGGHIEIGETGEQALKREIMEETGLEIDDIEFIGWQDAIEPKGYFKKKHFVFLDYCARMSGGKITKSNEMEEYIWVQPGEALKTLKIDPATIKTINFYLEHLENKANGFEDKPSDAKALEDKYKRALADYQNILKQTAREKMEFAVYANEQMLKEILPVYDHLKMAIEHHNGEPSDEWLTGVKHVVKQFKDVLEKIGVEEILVPTEASGKVKDKKFDHNLMDAIKSEETEDESLDGQVAKQIKAGYRLNGKVIEPAKVIVYKLKNNNI